MKLNKAAVQKAKDLIRKNQYVKESEWSQAQPDSNEGNEYLDRHGWEEYGQWHLGIHEQESEETKSRYGFPIGDFQRLHRSGLIAAKQRAAQNDYAEVEKAADELLQMLDETKS